MSFFRRTKDQMSSKLEKSNGSAKPVANGHVDPATNGHVIKSEKVQSPPTPAPNAPRILIIGAGSRGQAYTRATRDSGLGHIVAVCEPIDFVRKEFGQKYIWGPLGRSPLAHEEFSDWPDYIKYETVRRERVRAEEVKEGDEEFLGVDAVYICVLDEMHIHVVKALAPLGLHVMCEKPLATSLEDCIGIYGSVIKEWETLGKKTIFGICHVLRYSPHNMLLHKLVREDKVVGDVISVEHTEPVGWWHFGHSGNWRREDTTAPSLLTKSCHDIDWLLWMMCSPAPNTADPPHLPSTFTSSGTLNQFRKARKPIAAGSATNCLSCPIESTCNHSAKNIYLKKHFEQGDLGWPVKIVVPEIEDIYKSKGKAAAKERLLEVLAEDYASGTSDEEIKKRNWFGRCIWESDNDVCDDQTVTITWDDDPLPNAIADASTASNGTAEKVQGDVGGLNDRGAKSAVFHMIAPTELICERRGRIYGTLGEISYDSFKIEVQSFTTGQTKTYQPPREQGGHGGGDDGLANNFLNALKAVKEGELDPEEAQRKYLGCTLEEVVRSHIAVFAAEEARREKKTVDWKEFWSREVEKQVKGPETHELKEEVN